jgi:hypothetical protein
VEAEVGGEEMAEVVEAEDGMDVEEVGVVEVGGVDGVVVGPGPWIIGILQVRWLEAFIMFVFATTITMITLPLAYPWKEPFLTLKNVEGFMAAENL